MAQAISEGPAGQKPFTVLILSLLSPRQIFALRIVNDKNQIKAMQFKAIACL
jgi:hypothetical protein